MEELMAIQLPEDYWQPDEQIEKPKPKPKPMIIYSCDEDEELVCVDENMVNEYNRQISEYNRQVSESDGFDVDCFHGPFVSIYALGNAETATTFYPLKDLASAALDEYNQKNNTNMGFVKALKVNAHLCKGFVYYITFEVRDPTDGQIKIFQAKVWYFTFNEPPIEVLLCRKKPGTL